MKTVVLLQAAVTVLLLSLAYLGLMLLWIALQESLDAPEFALRRPIREFFIASLLVAALASVTAFGFLRQKAVQKPNMGRYLRSLGLLMVATGLVGIVVVIPATGNLSESGGFTPNFGHLLTYTNFTGALWLFLLSGALPYVVGYALTPGPRPGAWTAGVLLVTAAPAYFIGYAVLEAWRRVMAP